MSWFMLIIYEKLNIKALILMFMNKHFFFTSKHRNNELGGKLYFQLFSSVTSGFSISTVCIIKTDAKNSYLYDFEDN